MGWLHTIRRGSGQAVFEKHSETSSRSCTVCMADHRKTTSATTYHGDDVRDSVSGVNDRAGQRSVLLLFAERQRVSERGRKEGN